MTRTVQLPLSRLPSVWATYPRVLLTRRPPITEVTDPPEFKASVAGVRLDGRKAAAYASMCGFQTGSPLPVTFPHVLAMPLHLQNLRGPRISAATDGPDPPFERH